LSVSAEKRRAAADFNIIMSIFPLAFAKMSGAGNDFVIIDHRRPLLDPADQPDFARKICRRKFSVGADGLILLEDSDVADFKWQFYNGRRLRGRDVRQWRQMRRQICLSAWNCGKNDAF